jgi:hypothetical protein
MKKSLLLLLAGITISFAGFPQALDFTAVLASVDFVKLMPVFDAPTGSVTTFFAK